MIKEGKFGAHEMICLVVIAMGNKALFSAVSEFLDLSATSAWIMTLISCASASLLFIFVYKLLKRFPGKNLMEIFDITLGRAVGFVFSLAFAVAILFCCSILIREFAAISSEYVFPNTPQISIKIALMLPVILACYFGLESIARFSKFTTYFALLSLLLLITGIIPFMETENMYPVMGYGLDATVWEGLKHTCTYSEVIFVAIFAGSLHGIKQIKKAAYISLLVSGIIIAGVTLVSILVLSYPLGQEQLAPLYVIARQINMGHFFERLDPLFLYLWFVSTIITVAIEFYTGISVYCKAFKLQDHRALILPAAAVVLAVSFIPKNFTAVERALMFIRTYGIFVVFLMPVVALLVSLVRRKKGAA